MVTDLLKGAGLHSLAQHSPCPDGRAEAIEPCPLRTDFQRDRDRILHSKAFRRLKHKTQVFISPIGDHYRTRLTHSLEVSQIARTMARALRLNEDFTEAVALGHDIGHPPFGHAGEEVLDRLTIEGFCHSEHSVRIATVLEPMNLTQSIITGIDEQVKTKIPRALETQVVELADRIAYLRHDVEDALRAGLMAEADIPADIRATLGETHSARLKTLVLDLVETSRVRMDNTPSSPDKPEQVIGLSVERFQAMQALRAWMFQTVYLSPSQQAKDEKVERVIGSLFDFFLAHPDLLPPSKQATDALERRVCDYIAGMTDRFALHAYQQHLLPQPYPGLDF